MADAVIMTVEGVRTRASTNEALVTLSVPLEHASLVSGFMSLIGSQVAAAFTKVEAIEAAPPPKSQYGDAAKALKLSGFCRIPDVWKVLGSDDNYLEWVRRQPSAHSGEFSEQVNGEGRCEAAHVRRVESGAGISIKPLYAAIPLTHSEHLATHARGESALHPPAWFDEQRIKYVEAWAWERIKTQLQAGSMAHAEPKSVYQWASFHGIEKYLPKEYQHAQKQI